MLMAAGQKILQVPSVFLLICLTLLHPPCVCPAAEDAGSHAANAGPGIRAEPAGPQDNQPEVITLGFEDAPVDVLAMFFDQLTGKHHIVEGAGPS
jgi:hypothetical protein